MTDREKILARVESDLREINMGLISIPERVSADALQQMLGMRIVLERTIDFINNMEQDDE